MSMRKKNQKTQSNTDTETHRLTGTVKIPKAPAYKSGSTNAMTKQSEQKSLYQSMKADKESSG